MALGTWEETNLEVFMRGARKPARRDMGSRIVKITRGIGEKIEAMVGLISYGDDYDLSLATSR